MTCENHICAGRCGTPWECAEQQAIAATLHRYPAPITREGGATVEFEEARPMPVTMEDEATGLSWALFIVVCFFAAAIVVLPFVLGT